MEFIDESPSVLPPRYFEGYTNYQVLITDVIEYDNKYDNEYNNKYDNKYESALRPQELISNKNRLIRYLVKIKIWLSCGRC